MSVIRAKQDHFQTKEPIYPGGPVGTVFHIRLVNAETGERIPNEEIIQRFDNDEIVGVYVKWHPKYVRAGGLDGWPSHAMVTDIRDDEIILEDGTSVPKNLFHEWYVLD